MIEISFYFLKCNYSPLLHILSHFLNVMSFPLLIKKRVFPPAVNNEFFYNGHDDINYTFFLYFLCYVTWKINNGIVMGIFALAFVQY